MLLSADSLDYLKAFLGGIGVSLTPCLYPLIPITAGYIGGSAEGARLKGLFLSFIYVTGIAVAYSLLGLLASLTGILFGRISTHPLTYLFVGAVIVFFGVSMLDLFPLRLPYSVSTRQIKKHNYFSAFILGLSSGLVISPCLTPVLGSILAYLVTKKNLVYGVGLLVSFAYGMGFILIVVGTFAAALVNLPRIGRWTLYIKRIFSFILIITGLLFIYNGIKRF